VPSRWRTGSCEVSGHVCLLDDLAQARVPGVAVSSGNVAAAYAERWIRTVRAECLDWLLIIGQGHLDRILRVSEERG
jgi:hypothetical protein